jgi:hypothetical protein
MPNLTISPSNRSSLGNNIKRYGEIKTSGNFNILQGSQTEIISNEKISLKSPVVVQPSSSGTYANNVFTAKIEKTDLELVWFAPNSPGWVQKNDKLEIGIKLPTTVETEIDNFIAGYITPNSLPQLNPYNPEDINIQADFYLKAGGSWIPKKMKYAFFYEEFDRDMSDPKPFEWDWVKLPTPYRMRIRMTPEFVGEWKCIITTKIRGVALATNSSFIFNCYNSSLDGFIKVNPITKSTFTLNGNNFFPIGRNLQGPSLFTYTDLQGNFQDPYNCKSVTQGPGGTINPTNDWDRFLMDNRGTPIPLYAYLVYNKQLKHLSDNEANFVRTSGTPYFYDIEFEHLGNYHNRMFLGWEMDKMIETLEDKKLKMYYTISHGAELIYKVDNNNQWDWLPNPHFPNVDVGYCYGRELGITPDQFFSDNDAKKHYKNKLRYIISRWGYSPSIAMIDLFNESNHFHGWDRDIIPLPKADIALWQIEMHNYIKNVLGHKNHLIGVHYSGAEDCIPGFKPGVSPTSGVPSLLDNNVDVLGISKYDNIFSRNNSRDQIARQMKGYGKPFMFTEIGGNTDPVANCDRYIEQSKDLWSSTFIAAAGSGLTWHRWHESREMWNQFGNLKTFLGNWDVTKFSHSIYITNKNQWGNEVGEIQCRVNMKDRKAIGVIINRSWNQITFGENQCQNTSSYDTDRFNNNSHVTVPKTIKKGNNDDSFKVPIDNSLLIPRRYKVEYYRGLDQTIYKNKTTVKWSNGVGQIKLDKFDDIDTMVAFKIYPHSGSFLIPEDNPNTKDINNIKKDYKKEVNKISFIETIEKETIIPATNEIVVFPNPTSDDFTIKVPEGLQNKLESLIILGTNGEIIIEKEWNKSIEEKIDMSKFSSGTYLLAMYGNGKYYYKKIIKQ